MPKILELDRHVADLIAAGEVVERPASAAKELMENALDAGAKQITVEIQHGGMTYLRVTDNGCGIDPADVETAFLRHATSKLRTKEDLAAIGTLGFRGEALAAIASVSKIDLLTKTAQAEGVSLHLEAGRVLDKRPAGCPDGTTIVVRDLFYNTPARLKFMKRDSVEASQVAGAVQRQALAHPDVAFRLIKDGEMLLKTAGNGDLLGTVYQVYGRQLAVDMVPVESKWDTLALSGFVTKPTATRGNRSYQQFFVNGRPVRSKLMTAALEEAYANQMMTGRYPSCVLILTLPIGAVDVNVHPAKTEVRFRNKNAVFGAVFRAVEDAVNASFGQEKHGFDRIEPGDAGERERYEQTSMDTAELYSWQGSPSPYGDVSPTGPAEEELPHPVYDGRGYAPDISSLRKAGGVSVRPQYRGRSVADSGISPYAMPYSDTDEAFLRISSEPDDTDLANSLNNKFRLFDGTVVGQVFDTYLIVERANVVYVIDQHAAHERILYEKLSASLSSEYSQLLLIPHKLRLSGEEGEYFEKIMPSLNAMGFSIEKNPGNFMVYAVPAPVVRMDFNRFLAELFSHMLDDGEVKMTDLLKDVICRDACRAAIKGGEHLTKRQIEYVLSNLIDEKGDLPQKCPHGRPAVVALTKRDFEKMFMRIV